MESAECYSSAVNVNTADSDVGETQRAQEFTEGIAEEGKKELLRRNSQWRWKDIFTAVVLWFGYLSVYVAYSTIEPFFPNTVGEKTEHDTNKQCLPDPHNLAVA